MAKKALIGLMVIALSSLTGLLLIEGALYVVGLDFARVWEPDPQLGWHHVPGARRTWTEEGRGFIQINSLGQRDKERTLAKPPNTFRIAVYGDSMTEAVQVDLEQTFTYLLEEALNRRGYRVEVLNLGVNGYSPVQELLLLMREGRKYQADLVILATYLDNDVSGSHPALNVSQGGVPFFSKNGQEQEFDYSQAVASYDEYHQEPLFTIRYYSRLYRWLSAWRWRLKSTKSGASTEVPQRYLLYRHPHTDEWEEAWRLYERALDRFAVETNRQGAQLLVLSVPAAWVASTHAWDRILAAHPAMKGQSWDLLEPERRLEQLARREGLRLLAPYREFGAAWSEEPLYWNHLGHLTPRGHALMAHVVEDYLIKEQLVPKTSR